MSKKMARLQDDIVVNLEWCDDYTRDSDTLKSIGDCPVMIGDKHLNGKWFRDGEELLTPVEELEKQYATLLLESRAKDEELADKTAALHELGVYG